jgi:hypothetical protein
MSRREASRSKVHRSTNFGRKRAIHNCVLVSSRTVHPASACPSPSDSAAARLISDASQSSSSQFSSDKNSGSFAEVAPSIISLFCVYYQKPKFTLSTPPVFSEYSGRPCRHLRQHNDTLGQKICRPVGDFFCCAYSGMALHHPHFKLLFSEGLHITNSIPPHLSRRSHSVSFRKTFGSGKTDQEVGAT